MQITETNSEGLKRQLRVVIGADEIGQRFKARLDEIKGTVQLKGFRKGHVPEAHLKKLFGRSMMAETLLLAPQLLHQGAAARQRHARVEHLDDDVGLLHGL